MASFPGSVFNPATRSAGQTIDGSHINDLQDEVVAIEDGFRNATAPLNSSNSTMVALSVTGGSTLATLSVSGGSTFAGAVTFSAAVTLSTGITLSTGVLTLNQGQIEFPATQVASSSTRVLDDYREGAGWTPTDASGAGLALTTEGRYIKLGQLVIASAHIAYPGTANGSAAIVGGLPFTVMATSNNMWGGGVNYSGYGTPFTVLCLAGGTDMQFYAFGGGALTNANLSGTTIRITAIYRASN